MVSFDFDVTKLRALALFRPLTDAELEHIRPALGIRDAQPGEVVIEEGARGHELFALLGGRVKVVTGLGSPGESVIAEFTPLEVFGEMAPVTGETRSASVIAIEPCRFLTLHRSGLERVLSQHPEIAITLLRDAYRRLRDLTERVS